MKHFSYWNLNILQTRHWLLLSLPSYDGREFPKTELLRATSYLIVWKRLEEEHRSAAEILKGNPPSSTTATRGKLQRLLHRDWSNLCLAEKIILWEDFGGDVFMSALTLKKDHPSFFLQAFPFGLPIQHRKKLFALDTFHALLKNEVIWNPYKLSSSS